MPDIEDIPEGTLVMSVVRGHMVNKPELGGIGAMELEAYPGWFRRIDEVETVTPLVNIDQVNELGSITRMQASILPSVAEGLTNTEIAQQLFLSPDTVKSHLQRVTKRWNARNRTEVIGLAYEHGVLKPRRTTAPTIRRREVFNTLSGSRLEALDAVVELLRGFGVEVTDA